VLARREIPSHIMMMDQFAARNSFVPLPMQRDTTRIPTKNCGRHSSLVTGYAVARKPSYPVSVPFHGSRRRKARLSGKQSCEDTVCPITGHFTGSRRRGDSIHDPCGRSAAGIVDFSVSLAVQCSRPDFYRLQSVDIERPRRFRQPLDLFKCSSRTRWPQWSQFSTGCGSERCRVNYSKLATN
jgi:hypothetical protein